MMTRGAATGPDDGDEELDLEGDGLDLEGDGVAGSKNVRKGAAKRKTRAKVLKGAKIDWPKPPSIGWEKSRSQVF